MKRELACLAAAFCIVIPVAVIVPPVVWIVALDGFAFGLLAWAILHQRRRHREEIAWEDLRFKALREEWGIRE